MLSAALNPFPVDDLYSAAIMYKQMGFEPISLAPKTNMALDILQPPPRHL